MGKAFSSNQNYPLLSQPQWPWRAKLTSITKPWFFRYFFKNPCFILVWERFQDLWWFSLAKFLYSNRCIENISSKLCKNCICKNFSSKTFLRLKYLSVVPVQGNLYILQWIILAIHFWKYYFHGLGNRKISLGENFFYRLFHRLSDYLQNLILLISNFFRAKICGNNIK